MKWFFIGFVVEGQQNGNNVANEYVTVNCKIKISDKWETAEVKQPMAIRKYNAFMNGVDKSDQTLNTNNVLHKCV